MNTDIGRTIMIPTDPEVLEAAVQAMPDGTSSVEAAIKLVARWSP
jgi:hypothetical protein